LSEGTYSFNISSGDFNQIIEVEIDGTENLKEMMEMIAETINDASDGVLNASVFSPTSGESKLSIVASESGSSNSISIQDVSGNMLDSIGLNLTSRTQISGNNGGYSHALDELNSKIILNGINVERYSNVVDDLIEGVTFTLKQAMEVGIPTINLTVKNNVEATKTDIQDFIEKFNEAYLLVKENYKTNEDGTRGVFVGNASAIGLMQSLSAITSNKVEGLSEDEINYLSEIGVSFDTQKGLSITDSDDLEEALSTNPDQVAELFNSENGIAVQLFDLVENYVGAEGVISNMVKAYDKSVSYYSDKISFQETRIDKSAMVMRRQYEKLQLQLISLNEMQNYFSMTGIF
jgi:flagellar hook-associated protein 2